MTDRERWINGYRSRYICDNLTGDAPVDGPKRVRQRAKRYLISLGMGEGMHVFGEGGGALCETTQAKRKAWLLFAADLWDEGVAR